MVKRVVLAFGTRPEAIKMAPVFRALQQCAGIEPYVLLTGQHAEQLQQSLSLFEIRATMNLNVMSDRQTLPELVQRIVPGAASALDELRADYVLVHGDTLSTFAVAWAAFLGGRLVGHVEAGLRTHNLREPFPEEANRRLTDVLTDLDLAPTMAAKRNLEREGKDPGQVVVTGQTGIDAILFASRRGRMPDGLPPGPYVTMTLHRRENWPILGRLAGALAKVAHSHPEMTFVYPVHLNPVVQEAVLPRLSGIRNVILMGPLDYGPMAALLAASTLIVTDSGGLQEEGAALGVPVVVARNVTERPEGVEAGCLRLAGTDPAVLEQVVGQLLSSPAGLGTMKAAVNPYGDGLAAPRVAQAVAWRLGLGDRPDDWHPGAT